MNIEIINTGSELLLGRVLNTHQVWLCRQLTDQGYLVARQIAVADTGPAIRDAVREALNRAEVVITTGGLGPTSDDLTRSCLAEWLGRSLRTDPAIVAVIEAFYRERGRPVLPRTLVQAQVPEGARVLPNPRGTAPGLLLEVGAPLVPAQRPPAWLFMLPGPPRELYPMFQEQVLPLLRQRYAHAPPFVCRVFRTTGLGESAIEEQLENTLDPWLAQGLELGYCARLGEVEVRIAARGATALSLVEAAADQIRQRLGAHVFGLDDARLEDAVVALLTAQKRTVAVAESCTGGLLAHRLTRVPGASAVLRAGWVTYSNDAKHACLGVPTELLASLGAVSEPVARAMAEGARSRSQADYALAITGIAGPSGGTPDKPVGTVHIALAAPQGTRALTHLNRYERDSFQQLTAQQALDLLRRELLGAFND